METYHIVIGIIASWVIAKIISLTANALKTKKLSVSTFLMDGGFASAHTSSVTALATAVYAKAGFTEVFVVAALFALIVMNDAMHTRHYVGEHSKLLNLIIRKDKIESKHQQEHCGHTVWQVLTGFIVGLLVTLIYLKLFANI